MQLNLTPLCACGCGLPVTFNRNRPRRFLKAHSNRVRPRVTIPVEVRLWQHVDKDGPVPPHYPELGPCWVWLGHIAGKGYGYISWNGTSISTHRVSWQLHFGPIPAGLWVLHHCDNPRCIRPTHLFLGTPLMNVLDMDAKGRRVIGFLAGAKNPNAKLGETDVAEIRSLEGMLSKKAIARRFGISDIQVANIINRRSWK